MKTRFLIGFVAMLLLLLYAPCSYSIASAGNSICGLQTTYYLQSGLSAYPYQILEPCDGSEPLVWGSTFWGDEKIHQINDPSIETVDAIHFNNGKVVTKQLSSFSSENEIPSCAACGTGGPNPHPTDDYETPPASAHNVNFWADKYEFARGECPTMYWSSEPANEITIQETLRFHQIEYLQNDSGEKRVCPQETRHYILKVYFYDGAVETRELTLTLTDSQPRSPQISFYADPNPILRGTCTNVRWDVENVRAVFYNGAAVTGHETRTECPSSTATYSLRVVIDSGEETRTVTVNVFEPATAVPPTDTPVPPTRTPIPPTRTSIPPTRTPTDLPTDTRIPPTWTLLPTATKILSATPTPTTLAPPQVVLEDFMIADQLREFTPSLETTVFKSSVLWLKITNRGDVDFVSPSGTVNYTLEVRLLDSAGQELDSYDFTSAKSLGLAPLSALGAHETFYPSPLVTFFPMHAVNAGTLQVTLVPDKNSGFESLALAKPITVHEHADSFYKCCATVIGEIIKIVSIKLAIVCPECAVTVFGYTVKAHIALKMGELVTDISSCSDIQCALTKTAAWTIQLLLDLLGNPGQVISFVFDVILKMGDELPPCLKVVDFVNAFLNQLIFHRLPANGILTQSPVYPLVVNAAGQRTGFLADGALVEEIPDSRAVLLNGDKRLVLIPGNQELRFEINGYADGTADIDITLSQDQANGITLTYTDVPVHAGGRFLLDARDSSYELALDTDGTGRAIQNRTADHFTLIGSAAIAPQPRAEIPTPAFPNPNPTPNVPTPQQDNSAVIVVLVLTLVGAVFATFITFALTSRNSTRAGNSNATRAAQMSASTRTAATGHSGAYLQVKAGEQAGKKFYLKPTTTLGRDSQNEIVLADAFISRHHAAIEIQGNEFVLQDLKTANGTFVNGKLANSRHVLRDGDEIQIGKSSFKFHKG